MRVIETAHSRAVRAGHSLFYGGPSYRRYVAMLEKSQFWPYPEIEKLQRRKLRDIVDTAYSSVPFYRQRFDEYGVRPSDIQSPKDLQRLPILTKRDIQLNEECLVSTAVDRRTLRRNHTSGSTGHPLRFYQDKRYRDWGNADLLRCYGLAGYRWACAGRFSGAPTMTISPIAVC